MLRSTLSAASSSHRSDRIRPCIVYKKKLQDFAFHEQDHYRLALPITTTVDDHFYSDAMGLVVWKFASYDDTYYKDQLI